MEATMADKHPLQVILEEADMDIRSYSGRGMFGRSCLGVTIPSGGQGDLFATIIQGVLEMAEGNEEWIGDNKVADAMRSLSWDSMGLDMIVYWTSVPFVEDAEDDEEDEEDEEETED